MNHFRFIKKSGKKALAVWQRVSSIVFTILLLYCMIPGNFIYNPYPLKEENTLELNASPETQPDILSSGSSYEIYFDQIGYVDFDDWEYQQCDSFMAMLPESAKLKSSGKTSASWSIYGDEATLTITVHEAISAGLLADQIREKYSAKDIKLGSGDALLSISSGGAKCIYSINAASESYVTLLQVEYKDSHIASLAKTLARVTSRTVIYLPQETAVAQNSQPQPDSNAAGSDQGQSISANSAQSPKPGNSLSAQPSAPNQPASPPVSAPIQSEPPQASTPSQPVSPPVSPPAKPEQPQQSAPPVQNKPTNSQASSSKTVYITKTGAKYHLDGCQYLRLSQIEISKSDAIAQGYEACLVCKP
ncbi:MAG: hypothetical protein FWG30_08640 [Eubacteriaceae bacterium]|nr:hypothetical protein [Eubacteriaceae bacterium]